MGTLTWEPLLGNLGFGAAPVCSETFTMAEDPNASAVGEIPMFFALQKPKTTVFTRFFASGFLHHGIYTVFWCQCLAKTPVSTHIYAVLTMFQDVVSRDFLSSRRPLRNSVLNYFHLFLGTLLGNLAWEPVPANLALESWLGTCSWEPCLGTCSWEPGNFGDGDFGCSDLLRDLYCG